ncbi:hypothetical protein KR222_006643, partial [Zaprionus bogoriensis]
SEAGIEDASETMFETVNLKTSEYSTMEGSPQLMIVYDGGDLHCAMYFLLASIKDPFANNSIGTVLVEERLRDEFVARLKDQLQPMDVEIISHPNYLHALRMLQELNAEIITAPWHRAPSLVSPMIVVDCEHSQLGSGTTGMLCLRTFRSNPEIVEICMKHEKIPFVSVSIWNECIELLYQLVVSLKCNVFFFNCNNVSLSPIAECQKQQLNAAVIENGLHYETMLIHGEIKTIVFPIVEQN